MTPRQPRRAIGTAFTVSIEASEGVTTGISAHDRAHTIAVAIDPTKGADDIVSPGHVFPLVARDGGVLVRAGHTEAASISRAWPGFIPPAVICEIMNDDGTMARLPELVAFAQFHGLKIGTIADLIAYRRRHDQFPRAHGSRAISKAVYGGKFQLIVFRNTLDGAEHVALVKGDITGDDPTLVRVHRVDFLPTSSARPAGAKAWSGARWSGSRPAPRAGRHRARAHGHGRGDRPNAGRRSRAETTPRSSPAHPLREYGVGAQILKDLGVRRMILMSNTRPNAVAGP